MLLETRIRLASEKRLAGFAHARIVPERIFPDGQGDLGPPQQKILQIDHHLVAGDLIDLAAKEFLKPRSSSVFFTPPRPVIAKPTYAEANRL